VVDALFARQKEEGSFGYISDVGELCRICGIEDPAFVDEAVDYDETISRLVRYLRAAMAQLGRLLPDPAVPTMPLPGGRKLNRDEIKARVEIVRDRYLAGNLPSVLELGALLIATHVTIDGFPVHGRAGGLIRPLLNASGTALAESMVFALILHLLLPHGSTLRIDASLLPGHFRAWSGARGLTGLRPGEVVMCLQSAKRVVAGGFGDATTCGEQAREAFKREQKQPQQAGVIPAEHRHLRHPVNMVFGHAGNHLPTILKISRSYEDVALALGCGVVPLTGDGPMSLYLKAIAEGLAEAGRKEFDSVAAIKAARGEEQQSFKKTGRRTPWKEIPKLVRATLTLRTGASSAEEFEALSWKPHLKSTELPHSEMCWYLSVHGVEGGLASGVNPDVSPVGAADECSRSCTAPYPCLLCLQWRRIASSTRFGSCIRRSRLILEMSWRRGMTWTTWRSCWTRTTRTGRGTWTRRRLS
jgi:hypothetical protein